MRRIVSLVAAAVLLAAVPVSAQAVDRQVATKPDASGGGQGYLRAWRYNPTVSWMTWISACCYVPDISKPQYSVGRPTSDLYAAGYAASHFWPGCTHTWFASVDNRSTDGSYHTYYHINC